MIPLDDIDTRRKQIESLARKYLNQKEFDSFSSIPAHTVDEELKNTLSMPIHSFTTVYPAYFRSRWGELLKTLGFTAGKSLLEIASGDADMIPQAMSRVCPDSRYITANLNKRLNESLLEKTKELSIEMKLIDDDAINLEKQLNPESIDIIAFQHAANDVLQGMLCDHYGLDTVNSDWMEILPQMIELINRTTNNGEIEGSEFEKLTRPLFISMLQKLMNFLKPGGIIAINHYMFQYDLDLGYPHNIWENLIPIIRNWLNTSDAGLAGKETTIDGYPGQWWLFLRK